MKPVFCLSAILPVVKSLAVAVAKDDNLVDPQALRLSIDEYQLVTAAQVIESFAYETREKNRFVGTVGLGLTMEYIWEALEDYDYYDLYQQYFEFEYLGEKIQTLNIIAQTKGGDPDNVLHLGAHMDSTIEGPGMNDNASGGIGILETAVQLAIRNYTVNNAVRFSWWSAEEEGLIGSQYYVDSLSEEERQKIRLYLNFDMIASPAGEFHVYSSNFSGTGITAPPGVEEAERLFQDYFDSRGFEWKTISLIGSSDHWPFVEAGIPIGGLIAGDDPNYHTRRDTVKNMNMDVFFDITQAIAHAVGTYAVSFDSLPPREGPS